MSIFGSLSNAIPPDYFGDEFGLPLPSSPPPPPPQSSVLKNRAATTTQGTELGNQGVTKTVVKEEKNGLIGSMQVADSKEALAYAIRTGL
ncbi:hypothetical protein HRI_004308900 [Hibiscus trionum]|uniref:Uncharacterized protein n=1 Tax=Hibiscus trionum TaxID=183268 RepID=A0A9W7J1Q1_HIBTR|nr:hypothetical protein HRI_004308900 [Hibiscus trionum]